MVLSETAGTPPSGSMCRRTREAAGTRSNVSISGRSERRSPRSSRPCTSVPTTAPSMTTTDRPRSISGMSGSGGRWRMRKDVVTSSGASGAHAAQRRSTGSARAMSQISMPAYAVAIR
jgi:hypothetical protein